MSEFSDELKYELNNLSQSVAVDMCSGGDDPRLVAEQTLTVLEMHNPAAYKELKDISADWSYDKLLDKMSEYVCSMA